jgi:F-type H+-transporting ATPase subunit epsilon
MAATFNLNITTPDRTVYEGSVSSLIAPGELGYLGILANHRPIVAKLGPGKIILKDEKGKSSIYRSEGSGFLEVLNNRANLLLDSVSTPA